MERKAIEYSFNLNDRVSFELTPRGENALSASGQTLRMEDGRYRTELWHMANIFGPALTIGTEAIKNCAITIRRSIS